MRPDRFFFLIPLLLNAPSLHAEEPISLEPIVKEGSVPQEVSRAVPVTPGSEGRFKKSSSQGGIQTTLLNELPVPIANGGSRGQSRLTGLGVSAEDQQIETLGIPLSPAQGGGLDLNNFPQFLWSGYRYQLGARVGSTAFQGVAGNLSLTPWTESALHDAGGPRAKASALYSSSRLFQTAAQVRAKPGADGESAWAALAGVSSLRNRGPSASLSAQWRGESPWSAEFHLIGTSIDAESLGALDYPTPRARLLTARLIPVLKIERSLGEAKQGALQSIFYSDWMYLRSENPDSAFDSSRNHASRQGWKIRYRNQAPELGFEAGTSVERVFFQNAGASGAFRSPVEYPVSFDMKLRKDWAGLRVEPEAQVVGISRMGVFPAGALGLRYQEQREAPSLFFKVSEQKRFPSLTDRHYSVGFLKANPSLKPETVWTESAGAEWSTAPLDASLQGYFQQRRDVILFQTDRKKNLGMGRVAGTQAWLTARLLPGLRLSESATWSVTRIENSGQEFPYVPRILSVSQLAADFGGVEVRLFARASGPAGLSGQKIRGYMSWDLELRAEAGGFELGARAENLLNRALELDPGFPLERVFSVWTSAAL